MMEVNTIDPDSTTLESSYTNLKNAAIQASIAVTNAQIPNGLASQLSDDGTLYGGQMFGTKDEIVHAIEVFS